MYPLIASAVAPLASGVVETLLDTAAGAVRKAAAGSAEPTAATTQFSALLDQAATTGGRPELAAAGLRAQGVRTPAELHARLGRLTREFLDAPDVAAQAAGIGNAATPLHLEFSADGNTVTARAADGTRRPLTLSPESQVRARELAGLARLDQAANTAGLVVPPTATTAPTVLTVDPSGFAAPVWR